MKSLLAWWHTISLPQSMPENTPTERERSRYTRLTSMFLLVLFPLTILALMNSAFFTMINRLSSYIETLALCCMLAALLFNKRGFNIVAASLLIISIMVSVIGNILINPLDPVSAGILSALVVTVVLAGSLMPPLFALLATVLNCLIITLITTFQPHTAEYSKWLQLGYGSALIALPIILQVILGVITYTILTRLISTTRRADRAEEIIALQKEITKHQRVRVQDQQRLAERIAVIAQVHAAVANGDLAARVPLEQNHLLWQIALPLNNLLDEVQHWRQDAEQLEKMQSAIKHMSRELQKARVQHVPAAFPQATGTQLDALLPEIIYLSEQALTSQSHLLPRTPGAHKEV